MSPQLSSTPPRRETLDGHLKREDVIPYCPIDDSEWVRMLRRGFLQRVWHFSTWRNLRLYRGIFLADVVGFAWAGIYRSMRVPSIVAASFKNGGHIRAKERITGTKTFFGGALMFRRSSPRLREIIRQVNLRHHVAGVVARKGQDVEVLSHYEAAFAYVATAFIESVRNGYEACGVGPGSPRGKFLAQEFCTILYQIAGMVGLRRMPKDLEAHERFRDSYEAHLRTIPRSKWMDSQARESAKRLFPVTAAISGISLEEHLHRHLDPETSALLFPDPAVLEEMRPVYEDLRRRYTAQRKGLLLRILVGLVLAYPRKLLGRMGNPDPAPTGDADLSSLWEAYFKAPDDSVDARLIGAVLIHAIDTLETGTRWYRTTTVRLAAGEPLIQQGERSDHCYVLLDTSEPLVVTRREVAQDGTVSQVEISRLCNPTVLGEIGMWRNTPAIATVSCQQAVELRVIRLDRKGFESLKATPGFWTAVAAEVQQRLRIAMHGVEASMAALEPRLDDPRLSSLLHLLRYIRGDVGARLDLVPGIDPELPLAGCIDVLRRIASETLEAHADDQDLRSALENLLQVIG
jgi:CRP-like cAMP-binding protein